jgi:hypothetical protein
MAECDMLRNIMDEKKERIAAMLKDASSALVSAGSGAALAAATGATAGIVAATGAAAFLPVFLTTTIDIARKWKERDAAQWWHDVLFGQQDDDVTAEEIAGIIEANQEKPFVRETILRGVRAVGESVDSAVVVPLAMLTREYVHEKNPPDAFFRGVSRMLSELSASELDELRNLFDWVLNESKRDEITLSAHNQEAAKGNVWIRIPWRIELLRDQFVGIQSNDPHRYAIKTGISDPKRLFHLLRVNGLAWEGRGVAFDAGPAKVVFERATIAHFRVIIGNG